MTVATTRAGRRLIAQLLAVTTVAAVTIALLLLAGSSPTAAAQGCALQTNVTTAAELTTAVSCFESQTPAGNHEITIDDDIELSAELFIAGVSGTELLITGYEAWTITTNFSAPSAITINGPALVRITELGISGASGAGVNVTSGAGPVVLEKVTLLNNDTGLSVLGGSVELNNSFVAGNQTAGVTSSGDLSVRTTAFVANATGIRVSGGTASLAQSTVSGSTTGVESTSVNTLLSNMTVANNDVGVSTGSSGFVRIANSTIANNDLGLFGDGTIRSSVFARNSISCESSSGPITVTDTFADTQGSSCSDDFIIAGGLLTAGGFLGDFGCTQNAPSLSGFGCVDTLPLSTTGPALSGGNCADVELPDGSTGPLTVDGRGFPRDPNACAAGAFEGAVASCITTTADHTVASAAELERAVYCYNEQTPPGNHTIVFNQDIRAEQTVAAIHQPDPSISLTIDGNGHRLQSLDVDEFALSAPSALIWTHAAGELAVWNLTVESVARIGIRTAPGTGKVVVTNSTFRDPSTESFFFFAALWAEAGDVTVRHSTLIDTEAWVLDDASVVFSNATLSDVSFYGPTAPHLANSTAIGERSVGTVSAESSILIATGSDACSFTPITDLGNNFASDNSCGQGVTVMTNDETGLFGPLQPGCTGAGCTPIYQLVIGNPAIDAGNCEGVTLFVGETGTLTLDGKGAERPVGDECDAGADEWNGVCFESTTVFSALQLDNAIECFNQQTPPGSHTIVLGEPVVYDEASARLIRNPGPDLQLTIDGQGQEIMSVADTVFELADPGTLFSLVNVVVEASGSRVVFSEQPDVRVEVLGADIAGSLSASNGFIIVVDSLVRDSAATGVSASEVLVVRSTVVAHSNEGIVTARGSAIVADSVVADNTGDGVFGAESSLRLIRSFVAGNGGSGVRVEAGPDFVSGLALEVDASIISDNGEHGINANDIDRLFVSNSEVSLNTDVGIRSTGTDAIVVNSTIWDNRTGIGAFSNRSLRVANSTIAANDEAILASSEAVVTSSVFANFANQIIEPCTDRFTGGGNFALEPDCGSGFSTISIDQLRLFGVLDDNGCDTTLSTPAGCPRTVPLLAGHPAINGGSCRNAPISLDETGDLTIDQRGNPRDPAMCDAGAFQSGAALCDGREPTINMSQGDPGIGTEGDDVILGTLGPDQIQGLGGNDVICGLGGDDVIEGNDGNDVIFGGAGRDVLRGGPGVDNVSGNADDDRVLGGIGDDTLSGGPGNDYLGGFGGADDISGGPGDDRVFGGFGADTINGGPGRDVINGLIGNDIITGGSGDDVLNGDRGNDIIRGAGGDDEINGGNANDQLFGDGGNDVLNGGKADDTLSGSDGFDVCTGNKQNGADSADPTCEQVFGIEQRLSTPLS